MHLPVWISTLFTPYIVSLMVATGIGLIIGLEREVDNLNSKDQFAGIRTFPIISILGCMMGFLAQTTGYWLLIVSLPGLTLFVAVGYYVKSQRGDLGLSTSLSLILMYVLGILVSMHYIRESVAATVVAVTLLSMKSKFQEMIPRITKEELYAFVKFVVLALLILPFLPDVDYGPDGILNPFGIGSVVVIVSALSFIGYVFIKFGNSRKGIILTAILGGLFSSTAVSWIYSGRSKETPELSANYSAGIILASAVMFLRVLLIASIFNTALLGTLWLPNLLMSVMAVVFAFFILKRSHSRKTTENVQLGNPLNLLTAFSFTILYIVISLMVFYADDFLGTQGLYLSGLIAGFADVDAISVSMAKFSFANKDISTAAAVIVIASMSNTIVKMLIAAIRGSREVRRYSLISFGGVILVGLMYVLVSKLI